MKQKKLVSGLVNQVSQPLGKIIFTIATLLSSTIPAHAANLKFTYGLGVTQEYKSAAEAAALYWEDRLTDDATINIHLEMPDASGLPKGVLGGALPAFVNNISHFNFQNALTNDSLSTNDSTAVNNLPSKGQSYWEGFIEGEYASSTTINLTRANAKALKLIDAHSTSLDGVIVMSNLSNSSFSWEKTRTAAVGTNEFDFTSVLLHEIGHILGFVTALDAVKSTNLGDQNYLKKYVTPISLFSRDTINAQYAPTMATIDYGTDNFFTIDNGKTNLGFLSTGQDTSIVTPWGQGDGWQASHWKSNINALMNPALAPGVRRDAVSRDITVLDVIGWDIDSTPDWSTSYLVSQGTTNASTIGNTANTVSLDQMFKQSRWGGTTTTTTFNQNMKLTDFLAQEGLFQKGTFWSHMPAESTSVPEPTTMAGLFTLGLLGLAMGRQKKFN
ncbi:PEP-CTERM sorting domain-containing protein [Calothrix sp. FACHB-1219]|uniref:NF038122 family metalloprotease n=1 Tax=unclassified Calothrix TaxID=2619626 RepID=UPI0016864D2E|nr:MULTISPECIES: NF038122 family metalloprotease [unclassified Calothrix]MBD2204487.1 PEP-CTERM sorting domain-containing protein [Calothrix sp. FACHB-168]MBD2219285.1 PEP-CTERM sorting domain-containing protein [Calothrix sp. FACHB-1219]